MNIILRLLVPCCLIIVGLALVLFVVIPFMEDRVESKTGRLFLTVCAMLAVVMAFLFVRTSFVNLTSTDTAPVEIIVLESPENQGISGGTRNY